MGFIHGLLVFIEIVTAVLLVAIILLQKTKDEGLGLAFGAGVGETLFGSRAGNVLTKITIGLAVIFLVDTLMLGYIAAGKISTGSVTDQLPMERSAPTQPGPVGGLPAMPSPSGAPVQAPIAP
jgi:preprotein translocase subunit SecG